MPSTNNSETLVWVNACTAEVQKLSTDCGDKHCNSGTKSKQGDVRELKETCAKRRHIVSKGRLGARTSANSQNNLVYCFVLSFLADVFRKTRMLWSTIMERTRRDCQQSQPEHHQKDWPRVRCWVSSPVKQKKERYVVCWKEETKMEGQQLYPKFHNSVCLQEAMFIRAPQDHSSKNLDVSTFFF